MDTSERFDVFISYSSVDLHLAEALHERLEAGGFSVWFDKKRLQPPCDWYRDILRDCERSRVVLPILTENWARSAWTKFETYSAPVVIPLVYEQDLAHWSQVAPPLTRHQGREIFVEGDGPWESLFKALREYLDTHRDDVEVSKKDAVQVGYPHNRDFIGREEDLIAIAEGLFRARTPDLTQGRIFALSANGGYGKTTLARAYAEFYWRCYDEILWFNLALDEETADTPENARKETEHRIIAELGALHERFYPGVEEKDERARARRVLQRLSQPGRERRLLIIDDVAEAQGVESWLPSGGDIHVLITSRYSDWTYAESKPVYLLNPDHAVELLIRRSKRPDTESEREEAKRLAEELDHLPLALEQAAAYIRESCPPLGFPEYMAILQDIPEKVLAETVVLRSKDYPDCVARTWLITMQRLSPLAKELLEIFSALAPAPIPHFLFEEGLEVLLPEAQSPAAARFDLREAMTELSRYSLITGNVAIPSHPPGTHVPGFSIHKLTQKVVRINLPDTARNARLNTLFRLFSSSIPEEVPSDARSWGFWIPLAPHVEVSIDLAVPAGIEMESVQFVRLLGCFRHSECRWNDAEYFLERAHETYLALEGSMEVDLAKCLGNLGSLLLDINRIQEAESLLSRALDIFEDNHLEVSLDVAMNLRDRARLLTETRRLKEAEECFRRALEIGELSLAKYPFLSENLNYLALLLSNMNRPKEAERLLRRALELDESQEDPLHPQVATTLCNLALLLDTDRPEEAALLFQDALNIYKASYGTEHPYYAKTLHNLGLLFANTGQMNEAAPLLRRALRICKAIYGPDHLIVAAFYSNLAVSLTKTGRYREATECSRQAVRTFLRLSAAAEYELAGLRESIAVYKEIMQLSGVGRSEGRRHLRNLYRLCGWRPQGDIDAE